MELKLNYANICGKSGGKYRGEDSSDLDDSDGENL